MSKKFTKKKIFFISNLHSIHKEKHNFNEIIFLNLIHEDVLCQVFQLNEETVF